MDSEAVPEITFQFSFNLNDKFIGSVEKYQKLHFSLVLNLNGKFVSSAEMTSDILFLCLSKLLVVSGSLAIVCLYR